MQTCDKKVYWQLHVVPTVAAQYSSRLTFPSLLILCRIQVMKANCIFALLAHVSYFIFYTFFP